MHTASRRTILRSIAALLAADFARGDTKHSRRFPFVQWDVFSKVRLAGNPLVVFPDARGRSEERRVGKECRSRWSPYHSKKEKRRIRVTVMSWQVRRMGISYDWATEVNTCVPDYFLFF